MSPQTSFHEGNKAVQLACGAKVMRSIARGELLGGVATSKAFFVPLFFTKKRAINGNADYCILYSGSMPEASFVPFHSIDMNMRLFYVKESAIHGFARRLGRKNNPPVEPEGLTFKFCECGIYILFRIP